MLFFLLKLADVWILLPLQLIFTAGNPTIGTMDESFCVRQSDVNLSCFAVSNTIFLRISVLVAEAENEPSTLISLAV